MGDHRWVNAGVIAIAVANADGTPGSALIHLLRDMEAKKQAESFAAEVATLARQIRPETDHSTPNSEPDLPIPALTPRETDVLALLAEGADTAAIASQLLIGTSTVRNHIQRILHKLGVHSRLEAVACAREHGLLE